MFTDGRTDRRRTDARLIAISPEPFGRGIIKYVELKKYILHVKLTIYYTVSFTCNVHFLNSAYFISINLKVTSFRVYFAAGYILRRSVLYKNARPP